MQYYLKLLIFIFLKRCQYAIVIHSVTVSKLSDYDSLFEYIKNFNI